MHDPHSHFILCVHYCVNMKYELFGFNIVLYVAVGDAVEEDEVVCEIETDKVSMPLLVLEDCDVLYVPE